MSSVLVVVIVGVIIVAISVTTVGDGRKPATRDEALRRDPVPAGPAHLAPRPTEGVIHERPSPPSRPGRLGRVRAALLLGAAIVALGSLAAALAGGVLLVGYYVLRSALG